MITASYENNDHACFFFVKERGLLVRATAQYYTSTGAMPPLGNDNAGSTAIKSSYLSMMESLHSDTMNTQWSSAKTYGSQVWPDIQFDGYRYVHEQVLTLLPCCSAVKS